MDLESTLFAEMPKGSISKIIINRITDALINGSLKPGDKIPTELEFSEKLGVGRNAVREAVKVLVEFGVLEIRRAEGTFVTENFNQNLMNPLIYGLILSKGSMEELLEFKISLWGAVLYMAVRNATEEEITKMKEIWQKFYDAMMEEPGDLEKMYEANKEFNNYVGESCKNKMLDALNEISVKFATYTRHRAIEVSIERNQRNLLPDAYWDDLMLIETRNTDAILKHCDEKLQMWRDLLL